MEERFSKLIIEKREMTDFLIREFVNEQRELLELELNSEQDEAANAAEDAHVSQKTVALRNLEASDVSVGLYGRTVVQLTMLPNDGRSGGPPKLLPAHRFTVGDDVEIHSKNDKKEHTKGGVISVVTDTSISVALFQKSEGNSKRDDKKKSANNNEEEEDNDVVGSPPLTLIPRSSVEVHRKLVAGLVELERHGASHPIAGPLVEALFSPPTKTPSTIFPRPIQPFNEKLDESQLGAIAFALEQNRPVSLIHGPPGTGLFFLPMTYFDSVSPHLVH